MFKLNTNRLYNLMNMSYENCTIWTEEAISLSTLQREIKYLEPLNRPFHLNDALEWSKEDHLRRILYFIENPSEIKGIQVDNDVLNGDIMPIPVIVDGNHRLIAALYLKMNYVNCKYGGRKDVLDYLTEKSSEVPL